MAVKNPFSCFGEIINPIKQWIISRAQGFKKIGNVRTTLKALSCFNESIGTILSYVRDSLQRELTRVVFPLPGRPKNSIYMALVICLNLYKIYEFETEQKFWAYEVIMKKLLAIYKGS